MSRERMILLVMAAAMFTHIMDFMIIMPLGPVLMRSFDINSNEFSLVVSSYSFSAFISGLAGAVFIDRFDRKKAFLTAYGGFLIGTLLCGLAPGYILLLFSRSFTGFFGGIIGALVISVVSDLIPLERRSAGIGFVMAAFSVASVFGVPFGLFLSSSYGWNIPFLFLASIGIIIFILVLKVLPEMKGHVKNTIQNKAWDNFKTILQSRNAQYGLLFTSSMMLGHFTIIPFIAAYMVGNVGFSEGDLTYIYLVGGTLTIFTSQLIGRLADKYGRLLIFTIFGVLIFIPQLWLTHMPPSALWVALICTGLFFVFSNGRMVPSTSMITAVIRPENRGAFMSLRSSVQQLFAGIASLIAGAIVYEQPSDLHEGVKMIMNYDIVGYFAVFFGLITLILARKLKVESGA